VSWPRSDLIGLADAVYYSSPTHYFPLCRMIELRLARCDGHGWTGLVGKVAKKRPRQLATSGRAVKVLIEIPLERPSNFHDITVPVPRLSKCFPRHAESRGQFRVPLPMPECAGRINPAMLVVEFTAAISQCQDCTQLGRLCNPANIRSL
jgi:hypothetical protein